MRFLFLIITINFFSLAYCQGVNHNFRDLPWKSKETALYNLQFTTMVKTEFGLFGSNAKDTSFTGSLTGIMQIACSAKKDSVFFFHCAFDSINHIQFPLPVKEQQILLDDLHKGFYFSQKENGAIDSIYFLQPVSDAGEYIIIQLLEYYQHILPDRSGESWQGMLSTSDGPMQADYTTTLLSSGSYSIHLTSLHPVYDNVPQNIISKNNSYTIDFNYSLNSKGRLQDIDGVVTRETKINHKTMMVQENRLKLRLLSTIVVPINFFPEKKDFYARPLYYPEKLLQKAKEKDLVRSRELNIAGLIENLKENEVEKNENKQDQLANEIRICLVTDKDSLSLLRDIFLQADVSGTSFKTIRTALITASTDYAQKIICDYLIHNSSDENKLKKIIPSAGLISAPSYQLQKTLETFAFDISQSESIRSSAQLALGNIAGTLKHTDPARADSIALQLAAFLHNSNDALLVLSVLGNCGTTNTLPSIKTYLADSTASVKGYAFYALRFINEHEVDSLYSKALQQESNPDILENIFNALYFRSYNKALSNALNKIIEATPAEKTRLLALQVIMEWSYRYPELLNDIRYISQNNSMNSVRGAASQFLQKID